MSFTNLDRTSFNSANLHEANFSSAKLRCAELLNVDLSSAKGLDTIIHDGPSHLGIQTLSRSLSNLPAAFLQGTGTPDSMLTYARSFSQKPVVYATCLLIYASPDERFVKQLEMDLQAHDVLCQSIPYDMAYGDVNVSFRAELFVYDMLLLVISKHSESEASRWALTGLVKEALLKERRGFAPSLLPIHLDKPPREIRGTWTRLLDLAQHESRDFSHRNDQNTYQELLQQLLHDLEAV